MRQDLSRPCGLGVDVEARLARFQRELCCGQGAALELACDGENDSTIRILDVLVCPLEVVSSGGFTKLVTQGNGTVLGKPSSWAPAAMTKAFADGPVERVTVCPRLTTRYDLESMHGICGG